MYRGEKPKGASMLKKCFLLIIVLLVAILTAVSAQSAADVQAMEQLTKDLQAGKITPVEFERRINEIINKSAQQGLSGRFVAKPTARARHATTGISKDLSGSYGRVAARIGFSTLRYNYYPAKYSRYVISTKRNNLFL